MHEYCRRLYNEVKGSIPDGISPRDLWTHKTSNQWEVHGPPEGPGGRYWHGRAHCAWDAKAKAIHEWFEGGSGDGPVLEWEPVVQPEGDDVEFDFSGAHGGKGHLEILPARPRD